ncbi:MAG: hypothetical protein A2Z27_02670 [candidate division Zixibacteria bacterium RBG_16_50_21]|nr:MAG: hypothetical protein A2Z27_02670 [candidate division Zixibacteria bacterium RBG_16_50_21]
MIEMRALTKSLLTGLLVAPLSLLAQVADDAPADSKDELVSQIEPDTLTLNHRLQSVSVRHGVHSQRMLWFAIGNVALGTAGYFWSQEAWGTSSGNFHLKKDWTGDGLAQNDELSHLVIAYNFSYILQPVYQWLGFSPSKSMTFSTIHTALATTLIEYPIDAYNPLQGFGASDLLANYLGCGLALGQYHLPALKNFGLKISFKQAPWVANTHGVAGTAEEFDNEIMWLTFRPVYKRIDFIHFGVGYSTNHFQPKVEREYYLGVGTTLPDVVNILSPKAGRWLSPLKMFYLELHQRLN